jgi:hypothetical protein
VEGRRSFLRKNRNLNHGLNPEEIEWSDRVMSIHKTYTFFFFNVLTFMLCTPLLFVSGFAILTALSDNNFYAFILGVMSACGFFGNLFITYINKKIAKSTGVMLILGTIATPILFSMLHLELWEILIYPIIFSIHLILMWFYYKDLR